MMNHRIVLPLLVALSLAGPLFGSEKPRMLQFLLTITKSYTSPYNGATVVPSAVITEALDITQMDDKKPIPPLESNNLLEYYHNTVVEACKKQQQKHCNFNHNNKKYTVEITPHLNTNNTCNQATAIIGESRQ